PRTAGNLDVSEDIFVGRVDVIYVIGCVLEVTGDLACFRTNGKDAVGEQTVEAFARARIVGLGVAGSPVHQIEFGIVGSGTPRRAASVLPCVAVLGPRFGSGLAGSRDRVAPPQFLAGFRVPAIEEAARRGLTAGNT